MLKLGDDVAGFVERFVEDFEAAEIVVGVGQVDLCHELFAERAVGGIDGEIRMVIAGQLVMQMFEAFGIATGWDVRRGGAGFGGDAGLFAGGERFAMGRGIETGAQFGGLGAGFIEFHVTRADCAEKMAIQIVQREAEAAPVPDGRRSVIALAAMLSSRHGFGFWAFGFRFAERGGGVRAFECQAHFAEYADPSPSADPTIPPGSPARHRSACEVQMIAAGEAGRSGLADDLAFLHLVALLDQELAQMAVDAFAGRSRDRSRCSCRRCPGPPPRRLCRRWRRGSGECATLARSKPRCTCWSTFLPCQV